MVIVSVNVLPKPGHKQDFLEAFNRITPSVRAEEGCIEYGIYHKEENKEELFIFERWESQSALEAHLATDHMKAFFAEVADWLAKDNNIQVYPVSK